ncbi:MAG TPA: YifB family Mg chelatase-like AAA ATPase [Abditibacteriaceae bacterium]|jgi:magnesium chelatase family protein
MLACVDALAVLGVDAYIVRVEVDVSSNFSQFAIVGLPDAAVRESSERVRSALKNSGFTWPMRRITVNLAPADTKKQGPIFDLPIGLGVLMGDEQIQSSLQNFAAIGELGLDGAVRPVAGVLPMALGALAGGKSAFLVPEANAAEAAVVEGLDIYPVKSLADAVDLLVNANRAPLPHQLPERALENIHADVDWSDVKGQETVKRALEVAAAGGHNCLLVGSPGAGKTLLARRLPTILPPLILEEALEVTKLYSVAGLLQSGQSLLTERPFRAPHHTVSHAGLVGGGSYPRPGEISLAHHGVLFLDELPEFHRDVLEVMRQPLEDGHVTISRASQSLNFPSRFQLISAMNPCPCGYFGDTRRQCQCSQPQIRRYLMRISGPLLDRIDIHVEVPRLSPQELMTKQVGESSFTVRERVQKAREKQITRLKNEGISCNAQMGARHLRAHCQLDGGAHDLLKNAINQLSLSARAYDRILKVARTIADLDNAETIALHHIAEAINYRTMDRKLFG